jgi:hypothetical protein
MKPPFLELAYYVGEGRAGPSLESIKAAAMTARGAEGIIGLHDRPEEVRAYGSKIVVRTEGADFCGPMRSNSRKLQALGQQVFEAFVRTAQYANCVYGAILVEYELETPSELRHDSRSLAFRDFFLSRQNLPADIFAQALAQVPLEAYTLEMSGGVYISMSREFNPEERLVDTDLAHDASVRIAVIVGRLMQ